MTSPQIEEIIASINEVRPQSRQREVLLRRLLEHAVELAEDDPNTLDLKIAEASLAELVSAFDAFAPYRHIPKVTIFGSARTAPDSPLFALAHDVGRAMAHLGWMVVTGAGPGIMEAAMAGAGRERSFGVNIRLPHEQGANSIIAGDVKLVEMRYFFTRKVMLTKESAAFVVFPGGWGTQDELFELLTLLQNGKAEPAPVILVDTPDGDYWSSWERFMAHSLIEARYVSPGAEGFYRVVTSPDDVVREIGQFYKNFHSIRYVGNRLVIRHRYPLSDATLHKVRFDFAFMCATGTFEVSGPLAPEMAESDCVDLSRLVCDFNRLDFSALRALIDVINDDAG